MPTIDTAELPPRTHNNPPEDSPFGQAKEEIEALYSEASHWLDGEGVQSQADADGISKLLDMIRKAEKRADEARKIEKRPHDEAAKAVQSKYAPILDKAKRAATVCKQALTPWLERLEREKREAAEKARQEAEAAERAAQDAFARSGIGDLEEREEAERLAEQAKSAQANAAKLEKDKARAKGGSRATTLRTTYEAEVTDYREFASHVWKNHRDTLEAFLDGFAKELVRKEWRTLPGVTIHERKEAV